jgi:hypothetical protein
VDDDLAFMTEIHAAFVPNHSDDCDPSKKPTKTLLHADYLGFERQKTAQSHVQDARTPSKRLEGLISALSDFHAQAEWHKVHVHTFYLHETFIC